jgi:hypothetical protein
LTQFFCDVTLRGANLADLGIFNSAWVVGLFFSWETSQLSRGLVRRPPIRVPGKLPRIAALAGPGGLLAVGFRDKELPPASSPSSTASEIIRSASPCRRDQKSAARFMSASMKPSTVAL